MNLKSIILTFIVIVEIYLGSFFIYNYYQRNVVQKKVLGAANVVIINKSSTVPSNDESLKYYWSYSANHDEEDYQPWLGYNVTYHINNDGLNDLKDYSIEKSQDTYRIITLGDSFTFGHYVNTKENWTEQLEIMLNNVSDCKYKNFEVINLGMPGFDVQYIVQRYKELGQKYDPNLILWFESGSGFTRFNELLQPLINDCTNNMLGSDSEERSSESSNLKEVYDFCLQDASNQVNERPAKELDGMLQKAYQSFFNLPTASNVITFFYKGEELDVGRMSDMFPQETFVSLVPNNFDIDRLSDGHPNKSGHANIAKSVFEYLENQKTICSF